MVEYNPRIDRIVTVIGGSGFLGGHVVRSLARRGYRIRVAVRRPELAFHLQPLGTVGQIFPIQANLRDRPSVERAVRDSYAVINLVGILYERGRQTFDAVHVKGARTAADCAHSTGSERFVQVSAIGADHHSKSDYARSKAHGEEAALGAFPGATIMRPSVIFGPGDGFFTRFASMARFSPILPVISPQTRFQPVYAGDVAEAIAKAVDGSAAPGTAYELGGPEVRTFRELLEIMLEVVGRRRRIVSVPLPLARVQASILELFPGTPLLTRDQVRQLARDNIVSAAAEREGRTLEGLGITPDSIEVILPTYLVRFRRSGQFTGRSALRPGRKSARHRVRSAGSDGDVTRV